MPAPNCRIYPDRTRNLWLATSASDGASRNVGIKSCDQRCMCSLWTSSVNEEHIYCNKDEVKAFSPLRRGDEKTRPDPVTGSPGRSAVHMPHRVSGPQSCSAATTMPGP